MDSQNETTIFTFSKRANSYDSKMSWVHLPMCINPFVCTPYGKRLALDACAGTGAISHALINKGWNVLSLDICKAMLERGVLPLPVIGSIQSVPFLDDFFDLVVCRQGLQYTDLSVAISELVRVSSNRVILGHITKEPGDVYPFWDNYFKIASPGRKYVFTPGQIEATIRSLGYNCRTVAILSQQDDYMGPITFLDNKKQKILVEMLLNTSPDFKKLYNVIETENGHLTYSNRWEFVSIQKQLGSAVK